MSRSQLLWPIVLTLLAGATGLAIAQRPTWLSAQSSPPAQPSTTIPTPDASAPAPPAPPDRDVAPSLTSQAVRQGQFQTVDAAHPTSGTARLVTRAGQATVHLDNFRTERGPTVEVILYTRDSIPASLNQAPGDYISLGTVQGFSGNQAFTVPPGTDLSQYEAIGIWCRRFDITFGYANI